MKYFTIGTLALAGVSQAKLDAATTAACTGDAAATFANQQIADAGGNVEDYVINYNPLLNGTPGRFMTIMCKSPPWQHNGNVYDPYSATKWNKEKAEEYAKYAADHSARAEWLKAKGAKPGYPAGTGGKAWCGYKGDGTTPQWNFMDETPLCPDHNEVNEWHKFNEAQAQPDPVQWGECTGIPATEQQLTEMFDKFSIGNDGSFIVSKHEQGFKVNRGPGSSTGYANLVLGFPGIKCFTLVNESGNSDTFRGWTPHAVAEKGWAWPGNRMTKSAALWSFGGTIFSDDKTYATYPEMSGNLQARNQADSTTTSLIGNDLQWVTSTGGKFQTPRSALKVDDDAELYPFFSSHNNDNGKPFIIKDIVF
jgi:hypothetical protein